MVDLVHAGRDPDELAREFEPTGQSIRAWVARSSEKDGRHEAGLPTATDGRHRCRISSAIPGFFL